MGKLKTHKSAAKRFSKTANGLIKLNHTNHRHKLGFKTTKRKRNLKKTGYLSNTMTGNVKKQIPYA